MKQGTMAHFKSSTFELSNERANDLRVFFVDKLMLQLQNLHSPHDPGLEIVSNPPRGIYVLTQSSTVQRRPKFHKTSCEALCV